jgi:hypothetical protein
LSVTIRGLSVIALLGALGCSPLRDNEAVPSQLGEACARVEDCAAGLVCTQAGACQAVGDPGTAGREEACGEDADCQIGLVCGGAGRCARSRQGEVSDVCNSDASCAPGLRCANNGRCARQEDPGTAAEGEACAASADCGFGLICGAGEICAPVPPWSGVECLPEEGAARPLFEVPRGVRTGDFFRLPYPNDVLRTGDRLDLSGYPGTEQAPEPGDAISAMLAAVGLSVDGFSLNPAVIFRFSRSVDFQSLVFSGDDTNFVFVDVTPGSTFGRRPRARFFATTDRTRYICTNWLGIRPSEGSPLLPGHTYAVLFLNGVLDSNGDPLEADADFLAVTGNQRPQFPTLGAAWDRYRPINAWLEEQGIEPEQLIGGTVFTTGHPRAPMAAIRPAVYAASAPTVENLTRCDGAASSCGPCGGTDGVVEYAGKVRLSNFLIGAPPYNNGGSIVFEDGAPKLQRREEVCVSLAVPEGEMPARGWPVALFGHDTGGDFRTGVTSGMAANLASQGWATLSFDTIMHGERAGLPTPPDGEASLRALNDPLRPDFMRDHALQAAADLHGLVRLLPDLGTEAGVEINPARYIFVGHGLGGELGVPFVAYEPELKAAILAGAGGSVVDRLQSTRVPANLGAAFTIALAEPRLDGMHAGLHLIQTWLDTRDPMNYMPLLLRPPEGVPLKHIFMVYGQNDTVVPGKLQGYLAVAARIARVGDLVEEITALQAVDGDGGGNVRGPVNTEFTQVIKQYPTAQEGHDVSFEDRTAQRDLSAFLEAIRGGRVPVVAP